MVARLYLLGSLKTKSLGTWLLRVSGNRRMVVNIEINTDCVILLAALRHMQIKKNYNAARATV